MEAFLRDLLTTPGPSGMEDLAVARWLEEVEPYGDLGRDSFGNAWVTIDRGGPVILVAAHIDEIGLIVHYIDENGFLWVKELGGWDPMVLTGQKVQILTEYGPVYGVVGRPSAHFMTIEEQEEGISVDDLWIDIGASCREEAEALVSVGDSAVLVSEPFELPNDLIVSRSVDNRLGCYIVAKLAAQYNGKATLVAAVTAQEENTSLGLKLLARKVRPDIVINVDATLATDYPDLIPEVVGSRPLGGGVAIVKGAHLDSAISYDLMRSARSGRIPAYYEICAAETGTDVDQLIADGFAAGLVGYPIRYAHTPVEMASMLDVNNTVRLLTRFCKNF